MDKSADAFRTISEVALELDIPQHVLRFWETRFPQLRPLKRGGGRRYYRPLDVDLLRSIRRLLYADGYTIRGVQKILKARGIRAVATMSPDDAEAAARIDADLRSDAGDAEEAGPSLPEFGLDRSGLVALLEELRLCAQILDDARGSSPGEPVRDPAGLHSVDAP